MKNSLSKTLPPATCIVAFLIIYACTDRGLTSGEKLSGTDVPSDQAAVGLTRSFDKTVGGRIDGKLGDRWIANHIRQHGFVREQVVNGDIIKNILDQSGCVGISLYYAVDTNRTLVIIPVGKTETGASLVPEWMPAGDGTVSWRTATEMISAYSGTVRSHFFGANTFNRLFDEGCRSIRLSHALNDSGAEQVLLSDAEDPTPENYEDMSNPCPPCDPTL